MGAGQTYDHVTLEAGYRYKALSCPHEDASTMLRASEWTNTRVSPTLFVAVISSLSMEKTKVSTSGKSVVIPVVIYWIINPIWDAMNSSSDSGASIDSGLSCTIIDRNSSSLNPDS